MGRAGNLAVTGQAEIRTQLNTAIVDNGAVVLHPSIERTTGNRCFTVNSHGTFKCSPINATLVTNTYRCIEVSRIDT